MTDKQKLTVVADRDLAERIRQHQRQLSEQLGAKISLSQTAASLLTRGLEVSR